MLAPYQESRRRPMLVRAAVALLPALLLALAAAPASAELAVNSGGARPQAAGLTPGALTGSVAARCWQEGQEVLSEGDFASAEIPPGLRERALSLKGAGADARTTVILPLADALCLLTVRP